MCYHYGLDPEPDKLKARLQRKVPKLDTVFHTNGFGQPFMPVATRAPELQLMQWGLIPDYFQGTLNARGEELFEKRSYKKAALETRCLVPASWFFEWRDYKGKKYPYCIRPKGEDYFVFGGLYRQFGELNTFCIVTSAANHLMEAIHNSKKRMPLILTPGDEETWLDPTLTKEDVLSFIKPAAEDSLEAYTISKRITSRKEPTNVAETLEPFAYEELPAL